MVNTYKHIIWDFDGTLVDTYPVMTSVLKRALEAVDIQADYAEVYKQLKKSMTEAVYYFAKGCQNKEQEIRHCYTEFERACAPSEYSIYCDTEPTLRLLNNIGVSNYILTHRDASAIDIAREKGILKYFKDSVTKDMGFERKPNPHAFNHLLEKHQIPKVQALSIGDRHLDIEAGHNAGISGCLILDTFNANFSSGADYVISDRMSVLDILVNGV